MNRFVFSSTRGKMVAASTLLLTSPASASFLSGEALDTAADWLAIFILIFMPIVAIVLFWLVHILPEKVAEKRHHPQRDAITTLCLLSLAFGGLLWPIAWLWAYTRPVGYKLAYGTEKHEDYYIEMTDRAKILVIASHAVPTIMKRCARGPNSTTLSTPGPGWRPSASATRRSCRR